MSLSEPIVVVLIIVEKMFRVKLVHNKIPISSSAVVGLKRIESSAVDI